MRDKLIHQYFGVDLQAVWSVTQNGLPALVEEMKILIAKLEEDGSESG